MPGAFTTLHRGYALKTGLRAFLAKHVRTVSDDTSTHLSMDGFEKGNFFISENDQDEFFDILSDVLSTRHHFSADQKEFREYHFFLVEKTPSFLRFFADFDIKNSTVREMCKKYDDFSEKVARDLIQHVQKFYMTRAEDDEIFKVIITKNSSSDSFHIHFPNLLVNTEIALCILKTFKDLIKKRDEDEDYSKSIDTAPLSGSLRLLGASKCRSRDCVKFHDKNCSACERCEGRTKILQAGIYEVHKVLCAGIVNEEETRNLKTDFKLSLQNCSIIGLKEEMLTSGFSGKTFLAEKVCKKGKRKISSTKSPSSSITITSSSFDPSDEVQKTVQELVRNFHAKYKDLAVNKIEIREQKYLVNVRSGFCLNKKDKHQSNHIFFEITTEGIRQKCFNDKEDGCKAFNAKGGLLKPITETQRRILRLEKLRFNTSFFHKTPSSHKKIKVVSLTKKDVNNMETLEKHLGELYHEKYTLTQEKSYT